MDDLIVAIAIMIATVVVLFGLMAVFAPWLAEREKLLRQVDPSRPKAEEFRRAA